jgi:hypothetical protein
MGTTGLPSGYFDPETVTPHTFPTNPGNYRKSTLAIPSAEMASGPATMPKKIGKRQVPVPADMSRPVFPS